MIHCNPVGHHTKLTDEIIQRIVEAIPEVIVQNQVAYRAKVPKSTLHSWLEHGAKDLEMGKNDSIFAQLSEKYHYTRTEVLKEKLNLLSAMPKNYGALTWILEKCFREDFGAESEEMRQLKQLFMEILPLLGKGAPDVSNQA